MTAVSSSPSSLSSPGASPCHDSSMPERGRASVNIKADLSRASLSSLASSAAKRKRISLSSSGPAAHDSSGAAAQEQNSGGMMMDATMFDLTPRRRFKRRNSKCASMFYQMISPTTLLELQKIAGEPQEPGYDERMTVPSLHRDQRRGEHGQLVAGEDDESNRWSCTQLRRQMPATSCPIDLSSCSFSRAFAPASTPSTTSTHSILAEALRLSSSHLDEMASALLVHNNSEASQLADSDFESVVE